MPDAIFLIVSSPNTAIGVGDQEPTRHSAYLVELQEGETEADAVNRSVTSAMLGCELIALDASSGTRYRVDPRAEPVEEQGS